MGQHLTEHAGTYREIILQTLADTPELLPPFAGKVTDFAEVLATMLADGQAGWVVFVGGRALASKLLESIPQVEDYYLCIALREAIKGATSIYDKQGEPGRDFVTPAYDTWQKDHFPEALTSH